LAIGFAFVAAMVGAAICLAASQSVTEDIHSHTLDSISHLASDIDHGINLAIGQRLERIRLSADSLGRSGLDLTGSDAAAWTDALQAAFSDINWVALLGRDGVVVATSGDGPELGRHFTGLPQLDDPQSPSNQLLVLAEPGASGRFLLSYPLRDSHGRVIGKLLANIGDAWLGKAIESVLASHNLMDGQQALITDPTGRLLGRSSSRGLQAGGGLFPPGDAPFAGRRDWPDGMTSLSVVLPYHNVNEAPPLLWQVVLREDLTVAEAPAVAMRHRLYGLGVLLSLGGALLGIAAAQRLSLPLKRLAEAATQISEGQLVVGIPRLEHFRELEQLSSALRDMVGSLRSKEARLSMLNDTLAQHIRDRDHDFKTAHAGLLANEAKLRAVIESAIDGVMILNDHGVVEIFNRSCENIFGWSGHEVIGRSLMMVMPQEWQKLHQMIFSGQVEVDAAKIAGHARVVRGVRRNGSQFPLEISVARAEVEGRMIYVAMVRDITERVVAEEKLFAMATQDSLTGVRNRRYFLEGLENEVARCRRHGRSLSLLILDADYFKAVNDTFGHEAGDIVLKRLAETCRTNLREVDLVGRMGGEEFAIVMPDTDPETAHMAAERLRMLVAEQRIEYDGQSLQVTMSVGMASLSGRALEAPMEQVVETLMRRADKALYRAKKEGRNRVIWGIDSMESDSLQENG